MLFQIDLTGGAPEDVFPQFWAGQEAGEEIRAFAERPVSAVQAQRRAVDAVVADSTEHWRIERMAVVDRNVLRMAVYEMLFEPRTPPVVAIDEAIEVARRFGSEDSGAFINGVLDAIRAGRTVAEDQDGVLYGSPELTLMLDQAGRPAPPPPARRLVWLSAAMVLLGLLGMVILR
jgi:N utilization substance protein B